MGFHTLALTGTVTTAGGLTALGVVTDTVFPPSGNGYLMPDDMRVQAAYAGATNIQRARINAPSLLRVGYPSIRPVQQASISGTPANNPNLSLFLDAPVGVRTGEAVGIDAVTISTGGETVVGLLWVATKLDPAPKGEGYWLRFTSSTATQSLKWTVITPSFDQSFPSGTYCVTGLEFLSPTAVAARVVFPGSVLRPGVVAQVGSIFTGSTSAGLARTHRCFYDGSFGAFGTFQTSAPPSIEIFSVSADNANTQEGYLRVVRIGDVGATLSAVGGAAVGPAMGRG